MNLIRHMAPMVACVASALLAGCAGTALPSPDLLATNTSVSSPGTPLPSTTAATGDLALVDPLGDQAATGLTSSSLVPETLVGVYTRLARGLNRCWLKDGQPLGLEYVMHAKIDPAPATTGTITVHLRSATGRRGLKAYRIDLNAASGQTRVTTTNIKLLPEQSRSITRDAVRWATGGSTCAVYSAHVPSPGRKPGRPRPRASAF